MADDNGGGGGGDVVECVRAEVTPCAPSCYGFRPPCRTCFVGGGATLRGAGVPSRSRCRLDLRLLIATSFASGFEEFAHRRAIHIHAKTDCQSPGIETEKKTRTRNATGTVTEIEEETEIWLGTGIRTRIGIATISTTVTVRKGSTEIVLMIMIVTEAVILRGEETAKEMDIAGIGLVHGLQGAGIADLGLDLVQNASVSVDLTSDQRHNL